MQLTKLLAAGIALLCVLSIAAAPAPTPVRVFILAGQSNMEGQGVADLDGKDYNDGKGTLLSLMQDPAKTAIFKHLKDNNGHWTVRNDVWVRYQVEDGPLKAGPLTLGFTSYDGRHHFGPELQFGHVLGDYLDDPVLLIKTAWGGKSLYRDFRPPSSGGMVGPYYTKMLAEIREALANLKKDFPGYDDGGYELAGFVWYHGWNDGCEPKTAVPEYEQNLVNFIKDVRKDLNAPRLPFVIGELTGPWVEAPGEWATLRKAQNAAATRAEFQGTVKFVRTHDFVRNPEDSPNPSHGHHEFGNAETYFMVGDALGHAMKGMLAAADVSFTRIFDGKTLDGWKAADMSYWSIEDGAITGKITQEHPLKDNLYLIWQGGDLADFELKLKSRVFGSKDINNGFQFRSKELPNHDVAGYQVDNNLNTDWLVRLYDEHGRHTLAWRGQRTVFDVDGGAHNTDITEAKKSPWFKLEEWHEYHLICQGPRLTLNVDGRLASEVVDNDPKQQDFAGILGLQLHTGPPTTVQFKDIRLKVLKPASNGEAAEKEVAKEEALGPTELGQAHTLTDKTLVAWVAPANLTQHGGSVLTLEDASDHFDGIVFGEITPGKWMAGSDMFARTQQEQSNYDAETAAPTTFVQLAIVYRGKQVTLYRNGVNYARYEIPGSPQEFGLRSMVVFGKRHRHQSDNAHFAGAIDDARVYDRALTAEQIAALKPNESSSIEPWAWWSFDGPEAGERTGRFSISQLTRGARVEGGKLILDGKTGAMLCKTGKEVPFAYETPVRPEHPPTNWLSYHLAHPGPGTAMPGDPNCAFYWKGRYHLHYIYTHKDGFSFAHVSSTDLLHWRWHPTTLTPPKTEHGMFSGTGFFTREGRPAIIYHGQGSGRNQIAIAEDDQLEKWSPPVALEPKILPGQDESKIAHWDPDAWVDGGNYYAISGGSPGSGKPPTLFRSPDLMNWDYLGLFLTRDMPDVQADEDISCPNFFRIGNKHMLLCISHNKGCRYYLGQWKNEKFTPDFHARMNWKGWDFFAPESVLTGDGRRVMWAWCNVGEPQSGIQSLPRELSLPRDGVLRIKPLRELEQLRFNKKKETNFTVRSDESHRLKDIAGDAIELKLTIEPGTAREFGVEVYCDQNGKAGFSICVNLVNQTLSLGNVQAPFGLRPGEKLELRIFLDKTMIEVFANGRQAMVASHHYAPENLGVNLFSKAGSMLVKEVRGWRMKSIYTDQ